MLLAQSFPLGFMTYFFTGLVVLLCVSSNPRHCEGYILEIEEILLVLQKSIEVFV